VPPGGAMDRRFIGSNIALACGIFLLFSIFAPPDKNPQAIDGFFTGIFMIIGSLAYKSAKKRKLGIVKNSSSRQ
jgi:hypothetical protein